MTDETQQAVGDILTRWSKKKAAAKKKGRKR